MRLRDIKHASTFDEVAALYENISPFRNSETRPLGRQRKPYVNIRKIESGYACCYHSTDVVVWRRQRTQEGPSFDTVTVRAWPSMNTEVFADALTPWNLRFKFTHEHGYFVRVAMRRHDNPEYASWGIGDDASARCYAIERSISFQTDREGRWMPIDPPKQKFLDLEPGRLQRALNATPYPAFRDWVNTYFSFEATPLSLFTAHLFENGMERIERANKAVREQGVLALLADPNKLGWQALVDAGLDYPNGPYSVVEVREATLKKVRDAIYYAASTMTINEVEWYPWSEYNKQRRLHSK